MDIKQTITTELSKFSKAKSLKISLIVIAVLFALLGSFRAGEFIGFRKATFTRGWAENYHRNFGGPQRGFFEGATNSGLRQGNRMPLDAPGDTESIGGHGVFGKVISNDGQTIVVMDRDNREKIVSLSPGTAIMLFRDMASSTQIKADDFILTIGTPSSTGQIDAKFIRILPKQVN